MDHLLDGPALSVEGLECRRRLDEVDFWWEHNCLYLSKKAADAFQKCKMAAMKNLPDQTDDEKLDRWDKMVDARRVLLNEGGLPSFNDDHLKK